MNALIENRLNDIDMFQLRFNFIDVSDINGDDHQYNMAISIYIICSKPIPSRPHCTVFGNSGVDGNGDDEDGTHAVA